MIKWLKRLILVHQHHFDQWVPVPNEPTRLVEACECGEVNWYRQAAADGSWMWPTS